MWTQVLHGGGMKHISINVMGSCIMYFSVSEMLNAALECVKVFGGKYAIRYGKTALFVSYGKIIILTYVYVI